MSKFYVVKHKNEDVLLVSRSRENFTALSDYILEVGGEVHGCILTEDLLAMILDLKIEKVVIK